MHNAQIENLEKAMGAKKKPLPRISLVPAGIPKEITGPYIEAYWREHPEGNIMTVDNEALGYSEENCPVCNFKSYVETKPAAGKEPRRFCHHCVIVAEQKGTELHTPTEAL